MQLIHIANPSIVLILSDALDIIDIVRVPRTYRPPPCITRLISMRTSTHGKPKISRHGFYEADGLGCLRLFMWLAEEQPKASARAMRNRFDNLFDDHPDETMRVIGRIFDGTWKDAPGEQSYFCCDQRDRHPREMQALAELGRMHEGGLLDEAERH